MENLFIKVMRRKYMNIYMRKIITGRQSYIKAVSSLTALILTLLLVSCAPIIAPYNETAYQNATNLKVESLVLMDNAIEPYSEHEESIEQLNMKIDQAYEYAKGLPNNSLTTKQWKIMIDPNGNMLGGFLIKWKNDGSLNGVFVQEAKMQVSQGFDQIIELESAKIKE